jgi:drug/metabolite transporter (DMT)-like permease
MSEAGERSADPASNRGERLTADLILLAVAVVWGSGFVGGRVAGTHLNAWVYNGTRFLTGALALLPLAASRMHGLTRRELLGGTVAGVVLVAASNLQQIGLQHTTAGKAGFITGLYVVLVPLFAALLWRQSPHWLAWTGSLLAAAGLFLLSGVERVALAPGDAWVLGGAVFWALHILLIGTLASTADPLRLGVVQFAACGLLSTPIGFVAGPDPLGGWDVGWWTIIYNGVLAAGLGLTLQTYAQRHAPATDAAVILSLEAVFAALFGWLLLAESLVPLQLLGCGLMLAGMLFAQARGTRPSTPATVAAPAVRQDSSARNP